MKGRTVLILISFLFLFYFHGPVFAQAISDFSANLFEGLGKSEEKIAPKSPFAKQGVSTAEDLVIEDLILAGIIVSDSSAYALISGYVVEVGDSIAGFRVESIEKGRVALRRLDDTYILTMGGL